MPKEGKYYIWRFRIWEILEIGKPGDKLSNFADIFLIVLILSNIVALVLETVDSIYAAHKYKFIIFEIISTFCLQQNLLFPEPLYQLLFHQACKIILSI